MTPNPATKAVKPSSHRGTPSLATDSLGRRREGHRARRGRARSAVDTQRADDLLRPRTMQVECAARVVIARFGAEREADVLRVCMTLAAVAVARVVHLHERGGEPTLLQLRLRRVPGDV